jgi:hypothetical protein
VPFAEYPEFSTVVESEGYLGITNVNMGNVGVRPAFYINTDNIKDFNGSGTYSTPYSLIGKQTYVDIINVDKEKGEVIVSVNSTKQGILILALYDNNNTLKGVYQKNIQTDIDKYIFNTVSMNSNTKLQIFMWYNLTNMKPLTD